MVVPGTYLHAAEAGHLHILQWARANGCDWDEDTCSAAAEAGHLECLKWAREHGCPWNKEKCFYVAINNTKMLEWI